MEAVVSLDRAVIAVSDPARSNRFSRDVLRAELIELEQGRYFRDPDGSLLELIPYPDS